MQKASGLVECALTLHPGGSLVDPNHALAATRAVSPLGRKAIEEIRPISPADTALAADDEAGEALTATQGAAGGEITGKNTNLTSVLAYACSRYQRLGELHTCIDNMADNFFLLSNQFESLDDESEPRHSSRSLMSDMSSLGSGDGSIGQYPLELTRHIRHCQKKRSKLCYRAEVMWLNQLLKAKNCCGTIRCHPVWRKVSLESRLPLRSGLTPSLWRKSTRASWLIGKKLKQTAVRPKMLIGNCKVPFDGWPKLALSSQTGWESLKQGMFLWSLWGAH
ncbi:hypothetical protein NDU88_002833 [Pleurodeles waltl]|uniref:Uncharacterized protein n=1 Tax=Pleurodeles waltl TaxID=8319 RepID=A0AAV7NN31_PLEWA|nr:hypothetical protein NDU88_002833 [Pleurodeles waltl]